MRYSSAFVIAALVAPIFTAPTPVAQPEADISEVANVLEARADTVTCKPKDNKSDVKSFKVDVSYAKGQASKAGLKAGKSGDPHEYHNGDNINWGVKECDVKNAPLWEYPVFWVGSKAGNSQLEWEKDVKTDKQKKKTPIRVVFVNQNGGAKYCGVMTHSEVAKDYQGKKFFEKCT
ncbi:hypothetical protein EJ02DRAFT_459001 [Clathrospora elynae]|uniref:Uncharacterized protein n=1 Tax=Clathrospora elynae TaxID=706981 RepID=A0A6A5S8T2_9PLEO|nr:hypothetical protein EJ02DRAFT_459001 [Clathrospora elynae]